MANALKWIWPGLVTIAALATLAIWFEAGRVEADLAGRAHLALDAGSGWAKVEASGRDLVVSGSAPDEPARQAALAAVGRTGGARTVTDKSDLVPLLTPYRLSGRKGEDGIVLSGFVPSEAVRARVLDAVAAAAPGIALGAEIGLARGAPADLVDRAAFAAGLFGHLAAGEFEIVDERLTIAGVAASPEDFDAIHAALAKAGHAVAANAILPASPREPFFVSVARDRTGLVLSGYAPSAPARDAIFAAAREASGDGRVAGRLLVAAAPADQAGDWQAIVRQAIEIASQLSSGEVRVGGGRLDVRGEAGDEAAFARLRDRLDDTLPAGFVLGTSDIGMTIVSPYRWSATLSGDDVVLAGHVPAQADRAAFAADVARRFGTVGLRDATTWAGGAPEGFSAAVTVALSALALLETGRVSLDGQVLTIDGNAFAADAPARIDAFAEALPEGFSVRRSVSVLADPAGTPALLLDRDACQSSLNALLARNTIRFETGRADISSDSFGHLDRIGYVARRCAGQRLEIAGHTDSNGEADANLALSVARAEAVATYLAAAGVERARIATKGYGETRPVADNATDEGRAKNRRIEFTAGR